MEIYNTIYYANVPVTQLMYTLGCSMESMLEIDWLGAFGGHRELSIGVAREGIGASEELHSADTFVRSLALIAVN